MARAGQQTADGVYDRSKSKPAFARRFRLGVRHSERPAMVAHCCWSDMMCRMFGRGACALAVIAAAPVRSCLLFSISFRLGGKESQVKSPCGICFSLFKRLFEQAKAF